MKIKPFALERYFAKYEFNVQYLLSSSDCDGLAQQEVLELADRETRQLWDNLHLGYTESLGLPLLRSEVAKLYKGLTLDNILIAAPQEGIFLALNAMLDKGDNLICTFPGYQSLYEIAISIGCEVTKWLPEEDNLWKFNVDFLEKNIKANTKLIIINFPHNPTGYLPSQEDFQRILKIARDNNIRVLSDEMYHHLEFDPTHHLPSACEINDTAVSLFGMSKTFGLAGVRIGWLATRDTELYKKMAILKDYTTICSSAPSEILSLIVLRAKETIIAKHLKRINRNVQLLDSFFADYKHLFSWVRPKAGTIAFPRLETKENSFDFCQRVVQEAGIMLLPSSVYDYGNKHFRIGFGRENISEALEKFKVFLQ